MERYDSTMRAARHVIGVGTFAAAMLAMTAASASAQSTTCDAGGEGTAAFCGHVFTDTNGDGNYDAGEGTEGVVAITDSSGTTVANSPTPTGICPGDESCGAYGFELFDTTQTYWICVVAEGESDDCSDTTEHPETRQVTVVSGTTQFVDFEVEGEEPPPGAIWGIGTGTPGYWKNHPEVWPGGVTIGGVHYTTSAAIAKMGKVSGDKTLSMFAALVAAKLSLAGNNTVCITEAIGLADAWMAPANHPVGSGVKASSAAWLEAQAWHQRMDDYNNGKLCAPHRD